MTHPLIAVMLDARRYARHVDTRLVTTMAEFLIRTNPTARDAKLTAAMATEWEPEFTAAVQRRIDQVGA